MKLIAPGILLIHWVGIFVYFSIIRFYPPEWNNYGWSVFYFCVNNVVLLTYMIFFISVREKRRGIYCNDFVKVDILFTLALSATTVLQYYKLIEHTYGFYISIFGMIITTILIVINGMKYGLFKD